MQILYPVGTRSDYNDAERKRCEVVLVFKLAVHREECRDVPGRAAEKFAVRDSGPTPGRSRRRGRPVPRSGREGDSRQAGRAAVPEWGMQRAGLPVVGLALISLTACFGEYSRDVTAQVTGPATVRVGEVIQLAVTLTFSDGTSGLVQPSQTSSIILESSNTSVLTVSVDGVARGIAPGTATVTATPSVTSTGTGKRTAGTIAITVVP
jgi:hypothetical protein